MGQDGRKIDVREHRFPVELLVEREGGDPRESQVKSIFMTWVLRRGRGGRWRRGRGGSTR